MIEQVENTARLIFDFGLRCAHQKGECDALIGGGGGG